MAEPTLHERLVALQDDAELKRKAAKAVRKDGLWTLEELDATVRDAERIVQTIRWE